MGKATPGELDLKLAGPLLGVIRSCEVHCVAGCCGLDAFEFRARHIIPFLRQRGFEAGREALDQLESLFCLVGRHEGKVWSDGDDLNTGWPNGRQCLKLLLTWQREIIRALQAVNPHGILDPAWLRWNDGAVSSLARAIRRDKVFSSLPVLGDAFEEAGCQDKALLAHCRGLREHLHSCWVVELLVQSANKYD